MGIRHVSGPKKWPGIQSAKLIYDLKIKGKKLSQVAALLGISSMDANRRLRGFLAYKQMKEDSDFKSLVRTNHYTLLLEFLPMRSSIGKDWLGWDENKLEFTNSGNRKRLYKALTKPMENKRPEISNPDDARLFLKALSIDGLRELLEGKGGDYTTLHELGPIVDEHDSIKIITNFYKFLKRIETNFSGEVKDALKQVKQGIERILE
jgi:hypothetical protein